MARTVLSLVIGVVIGEIVIALVESLGRWWFPAVPLPKSVSFRERVAEGDIVPAGFFLVAAVGWGAGSLAGAWLAAAIARRAHLQHALVVGGVVFLGGLWDLMVESHPFWFWILGLGVILPAAWAGGDLAARMQGAEASLL